MVAGQYRPTSVSGRGGRGEGPPDEGVFQGLCGFTLRELTSRGLTFSEHHRLHGELPPEASAALIAQNEDLMAVAMAAAAALPAFIWNAHTMCEADQLRVQVLQRALLACSQA